MKASAIISVMAFLMIASCTQDPNKQIDEGVVNDRIYQSTEVGWTIEIPKDWKIVSKDKIEANDAKGKAAIEKSSGLIVDAKSLKHLISFQKNQFNIFSSTSEPYKEEFPGEYQQNNKALYGIIYNAFADQGINADTASGTANIQGMAFNTFSTTIYAPDGKVILHQIMFSRLLNGYDFSVNINYNNDEDKNTMIDALGKSTFTVK